MDARGLPASVGSHRARPQNEALWVPAVQRTLVGMTAPIHSEHAGQAMTRVVADRQRCGGWWVDAPGCSALRHHFNTRPEAEACARRWLSDLGQPNGQIIVVDLYGRVVHDRPSGPPD
jgi:hypothetical protein